MFSARLPFHFPDGLIPYSLFLLLLLLAQTCQAATADGGTCSPSSCGEIPEIKDPFRLTTDPQSCGNQKYNLSCESNTTVLYIESARYYVRAINYKNLTIRLVNEGIIDGQCSSLPTSPLSENSFYFLDPYIATRDRQRFLSKREERLNEVLTLFSCQGTLSSSAGLVETAPCISGVNNSSGYAVFGGAMDALSLGKMCRVDMMAMLAKKKDGSYDQVGFQEVHRQLEYGFELSWHLYKCAGCLGVNSCYLDKDNKVLCSGLWDQIILITTTLGRLLYTLGKLHIHLRTFFFSYTSAPKVVTETSLPLHSGSSSRGNGA
ncbi:unnamed protein product, partial [Linum tenue]